METPSSDSAGPHIPQGDTLPAVNQDSQSENEILPVILPTDIDQVLCEDAQPPPVAEIAHEMESISTDTRHELEPIEAQPPAINTSDVAEPIIPNARVEVCSVAINNAPVMPVARKAPRKDLPTKRQALGACNSYSKKERMAIAGQQAKICLLCSTTFQNRWKLRDHIKSMICMQNNLLTIPKIKMNKWFALDKRGIYLFEFDSFVKLLRKPDNVKVLPPDLVYFQPGVNLGKGNAASLLRHQQKPEYPRKAFHRDVIEQLKIEIRSGKVDTVIMPIFFSNPKVPNGFLATNNIEQNHLALIIFRKENGKYVGYFMDSYTEKRRKLELINVDNVFPSNDTEKSKSRHLIFRTFRRTLFGEHVQVNRTKVYKNIVPQGCASVVMFYIMMELQKPVQDLSNIPDPHYMAIKAIKDLIIGQSGADLLKNSVGIPKSFLEEQLILEANFMEEK